MKSVLRFAVLALCLSLLTGISLHAQSISAEKVYKISGKAYKGGLQNYVVDEANNAIWMTYVISNSKKKLVLEHYQYDLSLNFIKKEQETIEKEKARQKYSWYRGDEDEIIRMLQVGNNLAGQVVLKKGYLKVTYSNRSYVTTFVTEDKLKPKDANGDKMSLVSYRTEAPSFQAGLSWKPTARVTVAQGDATLIAHINNEVPFVDYSTMVIKLNSLEVAKRYEFSFEHLYYPIADGQLINGDLAVVFAPLNQSNVGVKALKKSASEYPYSPNQKQMIYMRFSPDAEVVEQIFFETPTTSSHIRIIDNGDFVSLIGVSDPKSNLFSALPWATREPGATPAVMSPTNFLFVKFANGKADFVSSPNLSEMLAASSVPAGSKEKVPFTKNPEKLFNSAAGIQFTDAFELQGKNFVATHREIQNLMQFDQQGNFEAGYFAPIDKNALVTWRSVVAGPNSMVYWLSLEQDMKKGQTRWLKVLQINPAQKSMGAVLVPGKKKYVIDAYSPVTSVQDGKQLIVLGAKKKKVYFAKIDL
jgi:hypothetical protein